MQLQKPYWYGTDWRLDAQLLIPSKAMSCHELMHNDWLFVYYMYMYYY